MDNFTPFLDSLYLLLGVLSLFASLWLLARGLLFYRRVSRDLKREHRGYCPKVSLIVPCKETDFEFEENIEAMLKQDYPNYHVIFVVDSTHDPAYTVLARMKENTNSSIRIVTSEPLNSCSGKVAALIKGVEEVENDTEVLAFADTDVRPHPTWLRNLVDPLNDGHVGATTGYRWYFPSRNLWSIVGSIWNINALSILQNERYIFAWGGSVALRKEIFEKLEIKSLWKTALSDDLALTKALKKAQYRIKFLPQCIVASFQNSNLSQLLDWTTRQMKMIRFYYPDLWGLLASLTIAGNVLILLGLVLCISALVQGAGVPIAGILMLCPEVVGIFGILLRILEVKKVIASQGEPFRGYPLWYATAGFIAPWIVAYNIIRSAVENKVEWRGVTYELRRTHKARVMFQSRIKSICTP